MLELRLAHPLDVLRRGEAKRIEARVPSKETIRNPGSRPLILFLPDLEKFSIFNLFAIF